jgi:hypothetical protein
MFDQLNEQRHALAIEAHTGSISDNDGMPALDAKEALAQEGKDVVATGMKRARLLRAVAGRKAVRAEEVCFEEVAHGEFDEAEGEEDVAALEPEDGIVGRGLQRLGEMLAAGE